MHNLCQFLNNSCIYVELATFVSVLQNALETQVLDERDKAQRLQTELDVSEQVQKDFVKLSQTLQVRNNSYFVNCLKKRQ